jgi:hypothetical protein
MSVLKVLIRKSEEITLYKNGVIITLTPLIKTFGFITGHIGLRVTIQVTFDIISSSNTL